MSFNHLWISNSWHDSKITLRTLKVLLKNYNNSTTVIHSVFLVFVWLMQKENDFFKDGCCDYHVEIRKKYECRDLWVRFCVFQAPKTADRYITPVALYVPWEQIQSA